MSAEPPLPPHPETRPAAALAQAAATAAPAGRGASLRVRLNLIVGLLMGVFIASLLWLQIDGTRGSVREEIIASNRVASQLLERVSWVVTRSGPQGMRVFLEQLGRVRANDISLTDENGGLLYRSPPPIYKLGRSAPAWFNTLVVPPLQRQVIHMPSGTLTIEADPSRAILDGWDDLKQLVLVAALALVAVNLAVFWAVGRTLKPFGRIVEGLHRMQQGDYATRLPPLPGREAGLIGESVNRLGAAIEANVQQRIAAYQTERDLADSREWAQRVAQRLEAERRDIASELHDELGQSVTAIRSLAKSLDGRLGADDAMGREAARLIDSEAARLYDAMHGMIPRLTPLALGPLGLPDALNDLVTAIRQRHPAWQLTLQVQGIDGPISPGPALVAYRVAQEAINNAIKHSGGYAIRLTLLRTGTNEMSVSIDDDGCGLPPPESRPARFGLTGLRERVAALGGSFGAAARPEGGSRVWARLPCEAAA
jgi:two-component system, NarL family, sensor histidine kinase UhpB